MKSKRHMATTELDRWMRGSMEDVLERWQTNDWDVDSGEVDVVWNPGEQMITVRMMELDEGGEKTGKVLARAVVKWEMA
jgi:hypothetical protein